MSISSAANALTSGLSLQSQRLEVSANNVANVLTPGFVPSTVIGQESATGGVTPVVQKADEPELPWFPDASTGKSDEGGAVSEPSRETTAPVTDLSMATAAQMSVSGTNLVIETTTQISATSAYQAQISAFKANDEATQSLMNLRT